MPSPSLLRVLRPLLLVLLAFGAAGGLAACGGGMSSSSIENKIDAASVGEENVADGATASDLAKEQVAKDADQRAAREAVRRRQELERLDREQKRQAEAVESGDVPEDSGQGLSMEEQRFRANLAGVCDGAQTRILKATKAAQRLTKQKRPDPQEVLQSAKDYNDALNDFLAALRAVDAPPSQQALYTRWLGTIDDLAVNIRLQLVSVADKPSYDRLQAKTGKLTTRFLTQTAQLGVTCLSAVAS